MKLVQAFQFTADATFTCPTPVTGFTFYNDKGEKKFHWVGLKERDWLGRYEFFQQGEQLYLQLSWNYARERDFRVVSFTGTADDMSEFVLHDTQFNTIYHFFRRLDTQLLQQATTDK